MKTTRTMRLANLKCPSCSAIQPHTRLTRTMRGDEDKVDCRPCDQCSAKLRIKRGRGLLYTGILIIGMFMAIWVAGVQKYNGTIEFSKIEQAAFIEGSIRIGAYLMMIFFIIVPVAARILKVKVIE